MKRVVSVIISAVMCLCLMTMTACSACDRIMDWVNSNMILARDNLNKFLKLIDNGDSEGIVELFAPNILADDEYVDDDIAMLLDYYEGDFVKHDFDHDPSMHFDDRTLLDYQLDCTVETTTDKYLLSLSWCVNSDDEDDIGLEVAYFCNLEDKSPLLRYDDDDYYPFFNGDGTGISVATPRVGILYALEYRNKELFKFAFSPNAQAAEGFDQDMYRLFLFCYGNRAEFETIERQRDFKRDASGKVVERYIDTSCSLITGEGTYYIAMRQCEKDVSDNDNVGMKSFYITKKEVASPYFGDGLWTQGINIDI